MLATTTTTITSDPGILCFHHCNVKVFCFKLPHICPNCNAELVAATGDDADDDDDSVVTTTTKTTMRMATTTTPLPAAAAGAAPGVAAAAATTTTKLLPFRLPYPFVRATQYPCAIVLRPSTGDFLNDYNNATDLHIAVTTSAGDIVEFDRHGLQRHRRDDNPLEWWQSLLVGDVPEPWYDYWDDILEQICAQSTRWSIAHYNEASHNCYTFVLAFLQALGYEKLSEAAHSKTSFCEKYIVPRTTTAGKYISLYRKLRVAGVYVHQQHVHQSHQKSKARRHANGGGGGGGAHSKAITKVVVGTTIGGELAATSLTSPAYTHSIISRPRAHKLCTIEE